TDADDSVFVNVSLAPQTFQQKPRKDAVPAAPIFPLVAALILTRGEKTKDAFATLADFLKITVDHNVVGQAARGPAQLPCVAGVGDENHGSRLQPFGNDAI